MGYLTEHAWNAEVVNAFREYVQKKYGKLHTVFGLEVEKALSEYLKRQEEMGTEEEKLIHKG